MEIEHFTSINDVLDAMSADVNRFIFLDENDATLFSTFIGKGILEKSYFRGGRNMDLVVRYQLPEKMWYDPSVIEAFVEFVKFVNNKEGLELKEI